MRKFIAVVAVATLLAGCSDQKSNLESKIDLKTGYGLIDYGSEGSVILGPGFVIVKRDSAYYMPQNGNTYHTMSVHVYQVPNCKDSAFMLPKLMNKQTTDTTTWNSQK